MMLKRLGQYIRGARLEAELTQKEVAHQAEVSRTLISSIENGKHNPTFTTLAAIAKTLRITLRIPPEIGEDDNE